MVFTSALNATRIFCKVITVSKNIILISLHSCTKTRSQKQLVTRASSQNDELANILKGSDACASGCAAWQAALI